MFKPDPADYMGGPFSVTFSSAAGDRQCITITLVSDSVSENQETFTATIDLESTGDVRPGVPAVTVVTILGEQNKLFFFVAIFFATKGMYAGNDKK